MIQRDQASEYGLRDMMKYIGLKTEGRPQALCEIGSFEGESATIFASYKWIESVTCIDPLEWKEVKDDPSCKDHKDLFEGLYDRFKERTQRYSKIRLRRSTSREAVGFYKTGAFDIVYIDGNHEYSEVTYDINAWFGKLSLGGFMCGHDYTGYRGVYDAVNEVLGRPDAVFFDSSWIKRI
jgi:hypothetical protein